MGDPAPNAPKWFAAVEMIRLAADKDWRHKRERRQSPLPSPRLSKRETIKFHAESVASPYPRLVPKDADCAAKLKKRTLTNLYNERPAWLDLAHKQLDAAVAAAYGWPADLTDEQILEKLLALNLARAAEEAKAAKVKKPKGPRGKHAKAMISGRR